MNEIGNLNAQGDPGFPIDHRADIALQTPTVSLLVVLLAGSDLDIQHILSWREGADELIVIGAGRMIG